MSSSASVGRKSPEAQYATASAPDPSAAATSFIARTPVGGRPQSSSGVLPHLGRIGDDDAGQAQGGIREHDPQRGHADVAGSPDDHLVRPDAHPIRGGFGKSVQSPSNHGNVFSMYTGGARKGATAQMPAKLDPSSTPRGVTRSSVFPTPETVALKGSFGLPAYLLPL